MELLPSTNAADSIDKNSNTRLACQACQRRKIKCDRNLPCQSCSRSGIQCIAVVNQRPPRGKGGGRRKAVDGELVSRIGKLETIIAKLQAQGMVPSDLQDGLPPEPEATRVLQGEKPQPAVQQYLGDAFWSSLGEEVRVLSDALDNTHFDDDDLDDLAADARTPANSEDSPPSATYSLAGGLVGSLVLQHPPPFLRKELCATYFRNVDPLFKILYAPAVHAHMSNGERYLHHDDGSNSVVALDFVLYYAAASTMSDEQCRALQGTSKLELVSQYRVNAERALDRADYIVSADLTTLQAFVIYLVVLRFEDRTRRAWTLLPLAVRIAHALGLHADKHSRNAFDQQQRRRLWYSICVLDLQMCVDLASDPLIVAGTYDTVLPLNVNDADLHPAMKTSPSARSGFTDMSFALITQEITVAAIKAHLVNPESWRERQHGIQAARDTIHHRYLAACDSTDLFQDFTVALSKSIIAACLLHAVRPTRLAPEAVMPTVSDEYILSLAVDTLEASNACYTNTVMRGWHWYVWPQWHALAVAFAALCFQLEGDMVERAWRAAELGLERTQGSITGGQPAQMSRPLEKLAQKARRARAAATLVSSTTSMVRQDDTMTSILDPSFQLSSGHDGLDFGQLSADSWVDWQTFLTDFSDPMDLSTLDWT